ncbi:MAG: bifunctional (p)ppGpp synthetase/guanosine-3',5'-bis(diphosphate) 3'-pyrophosphohydrolase [Microscillaceae bacterium]|nr:bifunctional (p)ppGpp synthetase/guanosine-3',5'-bis(diphosphate) 3'-pyrophosphohydrolase [Microscillaceae bacterium]
MYTWNPDLYQKAWHWATLAHEGQTYGGPAEGQHILYLNHIGSVVAEVHWALAQMTLPDPDLALLCAILHDTLEDTDLRPAAIEEGFGPRIAAGVAALTKDESLPDKGQKMADSLARIRQQPAEIWVVKMADRICNLQHPPYYWDKAKKQAYQAEAQVIYEALASAHVPLATRLQQKIAEYAQFF